SGSRIEKSKKLGAGRRRRRLAGGHHLRRRRRRMNPLLSESLMTIQQFSEVK
ncbi:hypothetical protein LINPERHAP1_LOCUS21091, partial [Linum perenne]